jgi:monothiol glutaredoxin
MSDIQQKIQSVIDNNDVVVFMKGTIAAPQCGFSAVVVQILNKLNVSFVEVDVMAEAEMREAVKVFSNWPTFPQLYIKQELVGGADITRELFSNGKLIELLTEKGIAFQEK